MPLQRLTGYTLSVNKIKRPKSQNNLVIEGAGGLLVPLNNTQTVIDLILPLDKVIVVSRHYLGSINHTLLTIEALKSRGIPVFGIIFNGAKHPSTESIITKMSGVPVLGRIDQEPYFDKNVVNQYAEDLRAVLQKV